VRVSVIVPALDEVRSIVATLAPLQPLRSEVSRSSSSTAAAATQRLPLPHRSPTARSSPNAAVPRR
jgi:hypothetical protein